MPKPTLQPCDKCPRKHFYGHGTTEEYNRQYYLEVTKPKREAQRLADAKKAKDDLDKLSEMTGLTVAQIRSIQS